MTTDPMEEIRSQLIAGIEQHPARRRRRRRLIAGVAAAGVVLAGSAALETVAQDEADDAVTAGPGPSATVRDAPVPDGAPPAPPIVGPAIWSIAEPAGWNRADNDPKPSAGGSLTLATVALPKGGECGRYPEQAVRSMSRSDALLTIFYGASAGSGSAASPNDRHLPLDPGHDLLACTGRHDLEVRSGPLSMAGQTVEVLVVFGSEVTDERRTQAWEAISTFAPLDGSSEAPAPACVVTLPPADQPGMPTTGPQDQPDPNRGWHGTPDLWTELPTSGIHAPRKSVWWSQHFEGGSVEPRPEIGVAWQRLDRNQPAVMAEPPGTNAHVPELGWFMINGIDPQERGCWKVSADYKGHELSYVYWNGPRLWTSPPDARAGGGDGAVIEGELVFDEEHNCFLVDGESVRYPVVWPPGSSTDRDATFVRLPDGSRIAVGDRVSGGGGFHTAVPSGLHIPPECRPESGEVAVFDPDPPFPAKD